MTKRNMLLGGLVAGAVLLAACSSSSGDETTTTVGAPAGGDSEVSSSSGDETTTTVGAPAGGDSEVSSTSGDETTTTVGAPAGGDGDVSIENFAFGPNDITVSVGDTITWINDETSVGHTTASDDGIWHSDLLKPGDTFEQTFTEAGTFTYFCSIHPSMKASITVEG